MVSVAAFLEKRKILRVRKVLKILDSCHAKDDPHFEISYGSEEVEEKTYSGISFVAGGMIYNLFAWDCDMTKEEWYQMAKELLVADSF